MARANSGISVNRINDDQVAPQPNGGERQQQSSRANSSDSAAERDGESDGQDLSATLSADNGNASMASPSTSAVEIVRRVKLEDDQIEQIGTPKQIWNAVKFLANDPLGQAKTIATAAWESALGLKWGPVAQDVIEGVAGVSNYFAARLAIEATELAAAGTEAGIVGTSNLGGVAILQAGATAVALSSATLVGAYALGHAAGTIINPLFAF